MRNRVNRPGLWGLVSLFLFALFAAMPGDARAAAGITSASWTALGPDNFGGRIRAIAIHPTQPNKMWVGSASGGIWRSTDGGTTWSGSGDFLPSMSITSIVISPTNPDVLFAGTGEYFVASANAPYQESIRGAGVLRSTDGGVTWAALAPTHPDSNLDWSHVRRLAIHPTNGNIVLAATWSGVFRTTNGGASWAKVLASGDTSDVQFDPLDGNKALASRARSWFSVDAGLTWTEGGAVALTSSALAYARQSGVVYASAENSTVCCTAGTASVVRSTNGGQTWVTVSATNLGHLGGDGASRNAIWVDPLDSNHVIVGGQNLARSTDGGASWTQISNGIQTGSVPSGQHLIVASPGYNGATNRTIFIASDGGLYRANDILAVTSPSAGWAALNNGLAITEFWSGAGHMGLNGRIIGGARSGGALSYSGSGTSWTSFLAGPVSSTVVDPRNGNNAYSVLNGRVYSSSTSIADLGLARDWAPPLLLKPDEPSTLYVGGSSQLWRGVGVDYSPASWTNIPVPLAGHLRAVAMVPTNPLLIWVGTDGQGLRKIAYDPWFTPSWTPIGSSEYLAYSRSLLIDRLNYNTVYAGFETRLSSTPSASSALMRTDDGGMTWTNIASTLPAKSVRTITQHPAAQKYLYAGTEAGLYTSEDGGANWSPVNDGPANVAVNQLFWITDPNTLAISLVAATQGRGMFRASVNPPPNLLRVLRPGSGKGSVSSSPAGITCGDNCSNSYPVGTQVTLTAKAGDISAFTGWSGACTGTSLTCVVNMNSASTVEATFKTLYALVVNKAGTGNGTINSSDGGITCSLNCTTGARGYPEGTTVTLTATPDAYSVFSGWSGACAGTAATCQVAVTQQRVVTATFSSAGYVYPLSVALAGTGSGGVVSSPSGIVCGTTCSESFPGGSTVTLTATPASGSYFAGWSGACAGTGGCTVTMSSAKSVTATFTTGVPHYALTVFKSGTGSGPVTSSPSGIVCGSACSASFAQGTSVTLTAAPNSGSAFAGWSGACSGTASTCVVTMNSAKNVTATFNRVAVLYTLTIAKSGSGSGPVTSNPSGIICGSACSANFASGASVTLTATPNSGSVFAGWTGACSSTASTCVVTMNAAKNVTATFNRVAVLYTLTIAKSGSGSGPVTSNPSGIICGSACSASFASGTSVTLTAAPNSGSMFAGWSGACTGTASTCVVNVSAAKQVTATFDTVATPYTLTITKSGTGSGPVTSSPAGIVCGSTCSKNFAAGTTVTLTATANSGSLFAGWSGACGGMSRTCTVNMTAARNITATFVPAVPLGQALDNTALAWSTSGDVPWFGQPLTSFDGVDAAQSGDLAANQTSILATSVTGPGTLSFRWRVDSQAGFDFLTFLIDGVPQAGAISGASGWLLQSWNIPAGAHAVQWRYAKDGSISSGTDRAWVDQVQYVAAPGAAR